MYLDNLMEFVVTGEVDQMVIKHLVEGKKMIAYQTQLLVVDLNYVKDFIENNKIGAVVKRLGNVDEKELERFFRGLKYHDFNSSEIRFLDVDGCIQDRVCISVEWLSGYAASECKVSLETLLRDLTTQEANDIYGLYINDDEPCDGLNDQEEMAWFESFYGCEA